jgi:hypothetical protein
MASGGYQLGTHVFYRPNYVPTPIDFAIDEELFSKLLILKKKKPRVFAKIINDLELFSESYYNSNSLSVNARVLCQMGAFEMLLDLPDHQQRKVFKDKIEAEASSAVDKKYVYYYEMGKEKRKEKRTINGIWADRFYSLRNHIIHGSKIPYEQYIFKKSQRHTDISLLFFLLLIKAQINKSLKKQYSLRESSGKYMWTMLLEKARKFSDTILIDDLPPHHPLNPRQVFNIPDLRGWQGRP